MTRMAVLAGLALFVLAGCGADGDPIPPTRDAVSTLTGPMTGPIAGPRAGPEAPIGV